jgi:hypothetical protein
VVVKCLVAAVVIRGGGIGSQPALGAGLTAVLGFVKSLDSHRIGLEKLLDDGAVGVVDLTIEICSSESSQIPHQQETPRLRRGFFFQFV